MKEKMTRPQTLKEAVERALSGDDFGFSISEFLDEAKKLDIAKAVEDEPPLMPEDFRNAWVAGAAEHLCRIAEIDWPAWTEKPERFLKKAWFDNSGLDSLKATLLVESPLAFRRRMVFTEKKPLRRV